MASLSDGMEHKAISLGEDKAVSGPARKPRARKADEQIEQAAAATLSAPPMVEQSPDTTQLDADARDASDKLVYVTFAHYQTVLGHDYSPGDRTRLPENLVEGLRAGGVIARA